MAARKLSGLVRFDPTGTSYVDKASSLGQRIPYPPSTSWMSGGPLIEQEHISLNTHSGAWGAWVVGSSHQTHLSAFMVRLDRSSVLRCMEFSASASPVGPRSIYASV
jgi:hypothetical protein